MKVEGNALVPAMPAVQGLNEQTYDVVQSRKTPSLAQLVRGQSEPDLIADACCQAQESTVTNFVPV